MAMNIYISKDERLQVLDCLKRVERFLMRRDEMNAAIHCAEVQYSLLTQKAIDAVQLMEKLTGQRQRYRKPSTKVESHPAKKKSLFELREESEEKTRQLFANDEFRGCPK